LDDIADGWQRLASHVDHVEDDVIRTVNKIDNWHGEGADAALTHLNDVRTGYKDAAGYIEKIPGVLRKLSDEISDAQRIINNVIDTVDSNNHLHIDAETGEVDTPSGVAPGDRRTDDELQHDRSAATDLTSKVKKALEDVTAADQTARSALEKLSPAEAGLELEVTGSDNTVAADAIPDADSSPKEVHKWWSSLNPMQQESAIHSHAEKIGGLD